MKLNEYMELNFKGLEISEKLEKLLNNKVIAFKPFHKNGRDTFYSIFLESNKIVQLKQTKTGVKTYMKTNLTLDEAVKFNDFQMLEV